MPASIEYKESVAKDLRKIDPSEAKRIVDKLEKCLGDDPDAGIPLKGDFAGLFKFRVGVYRVIYVKTKNGVLVLRIGHRKHLYA